MAEFLAERCGGKAAAGKQRIFLTGVVDAAQQVQSGAVILDHVHTQAAAKDGAKIQVWRASVWKSAPT